MAFLGKKNKKQSSRKSRGKSSRKSRGKYNKTVRASIRKKSPSGKRVVYAKAEAKARTHNRLKKFKGINSSEKLDNLLGLGSGLRPKKINRLLKEQDQIMNKFSVMEKDLQCKGHSHNIVVDPETKRPKIVHLPNHVENSPMHHIKPNREQKKGIAQQDKLGKNLNNFMNSNNYQDIKIKNPRRLESKVNRIAEKYNEDFETSSRSNNSNNSNNFSNDSNDSNNSFFDSTSKKHKIKGTKLKHKRGKNCTYKSKTIVSKKDKKTRNKFYAMKEVTQNCRKST